MRCVEETYIALCLWNLVVHCLVYVEEVTYPAICPVPGGAVSGMCGGDITLLFIRSQVAPCLGCVEEVSAVGDEYRRVAQLASELLEEELNMTQVTEVTQVYSAARQVRWGNSEHDPGHRGHSGVQRRQAGEMGKVGT